MELKPGYKQTEVGLIPEDWQVSTLGAIGECLIGLTYSPENVKDHGLLVLRSSNVQDDRLDFEDNVYVNIDVPERLRIKEGDILICVRNGSRALIGKCALIQKQAIGETFGAFMSVFRTPFSGYVAHQFRYDIIKRQIHANIGATINQITNSDLNSFQIPLPPLPEQRAIAAALSDMDALLAGLDALIAKKRDLKQAAMQQLLTGKQRLPGCSGSWEVRRLGDIADIVGGGTPSTSVHEYWDGGIAWCTPTDITGSSGKFLERTARTISQAGMAESAAHLLPAGALLLCTRATIGELKIARFPICTNQGFKSLVCDTDSSSNFLYYKLLTLKSEFVEKASGSTFLEISKKDVAALRLEIPPLPEQVAIAAVLSDMDAELAALDARRDKTRALKQGMMQELLTGRIRLL